MRMLLTGLKRTTTLMDAKDGKVEEQEKGKEKGMGSPH